MSGQLDLFSGGEAAPVPRPTRNPPLGLAPLSDDVTSLGGLLPSGVYLGASTWTFPGWQGLVYDRAASVPELVAQGLQVYAQHPVFRAVCIDRSFYKTEEASTFATWAASVPDGFRFVVKAAELCTLARFPQHARYGAKRGQLNPLFLDAGFASEQVVAPFLEGLKDKAGPLVFQFPPQDIQALGGPHRWTKALGAFLSALPPGPLYAVEVRNSELFTEHFALTLLDTGASPVLAGWGNLPSLPEQARLLRAFEARALVSRWMLAPHLTFDEAGKRYEPFNQMVDEDVTTREELACLVAKSVAAKQAAYVTVSNNAEGSAPRSIVKLAEQVVLECAPRPSVDR